MSHEAGDNKDSGCRCQSTFCEKIQRNQSANPVAQKVVGRLNLWSPPRSENGTFYATQTRPDTSVELLALMQNPAAPPVILASSSPYRRGLLSRCLDDFETVSPNVDETPEAGASAEIVAATLARSKAEAVSGTQRDALADALIIGADQLAVLDDGTDGRILGKPGDHQNAVEQLLAASGRAVRFLTAVCILDAQNRHRYEYTDQTVVHFRRFDRRLAESYLRQDEPYDCAGSFRIEGAGFVLFESVKTDDPTALIGLPMIWVAGRLLELGYLLP